MAQKLKKIIDKQEKKLVEGWKQLEEERRKFEDEKKWIEENINSKIEKAEEEDVYEFNVGGKIYQVSKVTLQSPFAKGSMLEAMFSGRHIIKKNKKGQIFIDRDGKNFRKILNFLRSGTGFDPSDESLREEFNFFGIQIPKAIPKDATTCSFTWDKKKCLAGEINGNKVVFSKSSGSCLAKPGIKEGRHVFIVDIDTLGAMSWIGVIEEGATCDTFIGEDNGWALSNSGALYHKNSEKKKICAPFITGDRVSVYLDLKKKFISWTVNGAEVISIAIEYEVLTLCFAVSRGSYTIP